MNWSIKAIKLAKSRVQSPIHRLGRLVNTFVVNQLVQGLILVILLVWLVLLIAWYASEARINSQPAIQPLNCVVTRCKAHQDH